MAKLKSHGHEIDRVILNKPDDLDNGFNRCRTEYSFRSDGHILRREIAYHVPDKYYPSGKLQDWGWKLWKKFKQPDVNKIKEIAENMRQAIIKKENETKPITNEGTNAQNQSASQA